MLYKSHRQNHSLARRLLSLVLCSVLALVGSVIVSGPEGVTTASALHNATPADHFNSLSMGSGSACGVSLTAAWSVGAASFPGSEDLNEDAFPTFRWVPYRVPVL